MIKIKDIFRVPIFEHFNWLIKSSKYLFCKDVTLSYGSRIINTVMGNHVKIGRNNSIVDSNIDKYVNIGENDIIINSNIGSYCYTNGNCIIRRTIVGKFCSIAWNVQIGFPVHPLDIVSTSPSFYTCPSPNGTAFVEETVFQDENPKYTTIGNDVWIGANVSIMSGVNIGTGAVIGTNALVTKDVEPYEVVGGVPAKHIKYRFDEKQRELLLKSKWWDFSEDWFKEHADLMRDVEKFNEYILTGHV